MNLIDKFTPEDWRTGTVELTDGQSTITLPLTAINMRRFMMKDASFVVAKLGVIVRLSNLEFKLQNCMMEITPYPENGSYGTLKEIDVPH